MNLYPLGRAATGLLVRIVFRIKHEGLENIPPDGGYILACNHRSNFDPLIIAQNIPVQVRYLAKMELLKNPVAGFIIRRLGIIPIKRGEGDNSAIETAGQIVKDGGVLGVFPEGSRSKDGVPLRPRSGVAVIAGQTGADVLPMAITYRKGVRFGSTVTVRYGPMIPNSEIGVDTSSPASLRQASKFVMDKIISLMDPPDPVDGDS
ncbi:MAG: 1-acyl-sn-glycerol-3-phosphate acyltransferase [Oscillospiraceae bacterium]|nr:1-acyl-sn-glycerol-3-phosphate acyltransferase [Oscillospiraceae bacterium]